MRTKRIKTKKRFFITVSLLLIFTMLLSIVISYGNSEAATAKQTVGKFSVRLSDTWIRKDVTTGEPARTEFYDMKNGSVFMIGSYKVTKNTKTMDEIKKTADSILSEELGATVKITGYGKRNTGLGKADVMNCKAQEGNEIYTMRFFFIKKNGYMFAGSSINMTVKNENKILKSLKFQK